MVINKRWMWGLSLLFTLFTIMLLAKGMELHALGTDVDGEGIGVHLMGFEVNDRVYEERIPVYAKSFLLMGLLMFCSAVFTFWKSFKMFYKKSTL